MDDGAGSDGSARLIAPAPPIRSEHAKVVAADRRQVARRHDRDSRECLELDPALGERRAQPPLALLRVGADVLAHEDRTRIRLEREPDGLADDVPAPDDDCPAPRPQRRAQIAERVEQEGDAVRRSEGREHRIVQDEEGNDPLRPFHGRGERRLVVQAQVAREQHHHRPAFAHLDKG